MTRIAAGGAINIIPARCTLAIDRRAVPGERTDEIVAEVERAAAGVDWPEKINVRLVTCNEPSETDVTEPIVLSALSGASEVFGKKVTPGGFTATCDMWVLRNLCGIPTVVMGPGHLDQAHKANEYIEEDSLLSGARIYAATALDFFRRAQ